MAETESKLNELVNTLLRIDHGDLELFVPAGVRVAQAEPWLMGHYLGYNLLHGHTRDSQVALPPIALRGIPESRDFQDLRENGVSYMMLLGPRELYRSVMWGKALTKRGYLVSGGSKRLLMELGEQYLRVRESNEERLLTAIAAHREAMMGLYAVFHVQPSKPAQNALYGVPTTRPHYGHNAKDGKPYQKGWEGGRRETGDDNILAAIKDLPHADPLTAAGYIEQYNIRPSILKPIIGKKPDSLMMMAMMRKMTGNELLKAQKFFKRHGVFADAMMKAMYDEAMSKIGSGKGTAILGAQHVADALEDEQDPVFAIVRQHLSQVQEEVLAAVPGIEGDWAVIADCSSSQAHSIELGKQTAALIAHQVRGKVHLIFFNTEAHYFEVGGKTLAQIKAMTREISAVGRTSCGIGLDYLRRHEIAVQGVAEITDGGQNSYPPLPEAYKNYVSQMGVEPTLYYLHTAGDPDETVDVLGRHKVAYQYIEMAKDNIDWNSLPGIVDQLRVNPHTLLDDIRKTPLLTRADVFKERVRA